MNIRLTNLFLLVFISVATKITHAQDLFCYRDEMGILHCNKSIDLLPPSYRSKIFFKQDIQNNQDNTRSKPLTNLQENQTQELEKESNDRSQDLDENTPETKLPPLVNTKPNSLPPAAQLKVNNTSETPKLPALEAETKNLDKPKKLDENVNEANSNPINKTTTEAIKTTPSTNNTKQPKIEIFVAKWCPHCRSLEDFLKLQKLKYSKYDVEEDDYGIEVFNKEGGGIPITKIGDSTIVGYDEKKFKAILESKIPY